MRLTIASWFAFIPLFCNGLSILIQNQYGHPISWRLVRYTRAHNKSLSLNTSKSITKELIETTEPDLIHCIDQLSSDVLEYVDTHNIPLMMSVTDTNIDWLNDYPNTCQFCCYSNYSYQYVCQRYPHYKERTTLIKPQLVSPRTLPNSFRLEHAIQDDRFVITQIGTSEECARTLSLLEELRQSIPQLHLVLICTTALPKETEACDWITTANKTHTNLLDVIQGTDLLLSTAIEGSTCDDILLALSCNKLLICTNIPAHTEFIRQGLNGLLIHTGAFFDQDLTNGISLIYRDHKYRDELLDTTRRYASISSNKDEAEAYLNLYTTYARNTSEALTN